MTEEEWKRREYIRMENEWKQKWMKYDVAMAYEKMNFSEMTDEQKMAWSFPEDNRHHKKTMEVCPFSVKLNMFGTDRELVGRLPKKVLELPEIFGCEIGDVTCTS